MIEWNRLEQHGIASVAATLDLQDRMCRYALKVYSSVGFRDVAAIV
jgi:hypothetical protein